MQVAIRTDASLVIGSGHLMRCLALAEALREKGIKVFFICRTLKGNLIGLIEKKGFEVYKLAGEDSHGKLQGQPSDYSAWLGVSWERDAAQVRDILEKNKTTVDWLVVDHYSLDKRWEKALRPYSKEIMVIDDLANREHNCDLLLDQNYHPEMAARYKKLLPQQSRILLGPNYALLRREFADARKNPRRKSRLIKRIFVFFGGTDSTNETAKCLLAINRINRSDISVDIVLGINNPHKVAIKRLSAKSKQVKLYVNTGNVARIMAKADLAIGAAGTNTWERCCLGIPSLTIAVSANQEPIARNCEKAGISVYLGRPQDVNVDAINRALSKLIENNTGIQEMRKAAFELVDGKGTNRICGALLNRKR